MIRFHLRMCKIECHSIVISCAKLFDMICSCTKRRGSECSTLLHPREKNFEEVEDFYCQNRQHILMR